MCIDSQDYCCYLLVVTDIFIILYVLSSALQQYFGEEILRLRVSIELASSYELYIMYMLVMPVFISVNGLCLLFHL